jgi:hypothetical protein
LYEAKGTTQSSSNPVQYAIALVDKNIEKRLKFSDTCLDIGDDGLFLESFYPGEEKRVTVSEHSLQQSTEKL